MIRSLGGCMEKKSLKKLAKQLISFAFSREFITYTIMGILTTAVNYISFHIICNILGVEDLIANAIAWVIAVTFAYATNARFVFLSRRESIKGEAAKITKFFGARFLTLIVEEAGIFIFVILLHYSNLVVKAALAVVVILLNYVLSKLFIFKSNE